MPTSIHRLITDLSYRRIADMVVVECASIRALTAASIAHSAGAGRHVPQHTLKSHPR